MNWLSRGRMLFGWNPLHGPGLRRTVITIFALACLGTFFGAYSTEVNSVCDEKCETRCTADCDFRCCVPKIKKLLLPVEKSHIRLTINQAPPPSSPKAVVVTKVAVEKDNSKTCHVRCPKMCFPQCSTECCIPKLSPQQPVLRVKDVDTYRCKNSGCSDFCYPACADACCKYYLGRTTKIVPALATAAPTVQTWCKNDCRASCAPACSKECCSRTASNSLVTSVPVRALVSPSGVPKSIKIGLFIPDSRCEKSCETFCGPKCRPSCCIPDNVLPACSVECSTTKCAANCPESCCSPYVDRLAPAVPLEVTSCPNGCSSTCAPTCSTDCCSLVAEDSDQVCPGSCQFTCGVECPPNCCLSDAGMFTGCASHCPAHCAPNCSPDCCSGGIPRRTGSVLSLDLSCDPACAELCSPGCDVRCCSRPLRSNFFDRGVCSSTCPLSCYPRCHPKCCNPKNDYDVCPASCSTNCDPLICTPDCCTPEARESIVNLASKLINKLKCLDPCRDECAPDCTEACCSSNQFYTTDENGALVGTRVVAPDACAPPCNVACNAGCSKECCARIKLRTFPSSLDPESDGRSATLTISLEGTDEDRYRCPVNCPDTCLPGCSEDCCRPYTEPSSLTSAAVQADGLVTSQYTPIKSETVVVEQPVVSQPIVLEQADGSKPVVALTQPVTSALRPTKIPEIVLRIVGASPDAVKLDSCPTACRDNCAVDCPYGCCKRNGIQANDTTIVINATDLGIPSVSKCLNESECPKTIRINDILTNLLRKTETINVSPSKGCSSLCQIICLPNCEKDCCRRTTTDASKEVEDLPPKITIEIQTPSTVASTGSKDSTPSPTENAQVNLSPGAPIRTPPSVVGSNGGDDSFAQPPMQQYQVDPTFGAWSPIQNNPVIYSPPGATYQLPSTVLQPLPSPVYVPQTSYITMYNPSYEPGGMISKSYEGSYIPRSFVNNGINGETVDETQAPPPVTPPPPPPPSLPPSEHESTTPAPAGKSESKSKYATHVNGTHSVSMVSCPDNCPTTCAPDCEMECCHSSAVISKEKSCPGACPRICLPKCNPKCCGGTEEMTWDKKKSDIPNDNYGQEDWR